MRLYLSEHKGGRAANTLLHLNVANVDDIAAEFGEAVDEDGLAGRQVNLVDPDGNRLRVATPRRRVNGPRRTSGGLARDPVGDVPSNDTRVVFPQPVPARPQTRPQPVQRPQDAHRLTHRALRAAVDHTEPRSPLPDSFVHLHLHTEYSMLDGASRIGEVVAAAAADGQPAVGITDHGNMYGALELYTAAKAAGIKPVLGMEGYFTNASRFDRPKRSEHEIFHLTMLAETEQGYRNLIKVTSHAYLDGYYYKPRTDWELLETYHEGITATTGCLGGLVSQLILQGDEHGRARGGRALPGHLRTRALLRRAPGPRP